MSDALAVTLTVPLTVAPFVGAVIDVVGVVVSAIPVVIATETSSMRNHVASETSVVVLNCSVTVKPL